MTVAQVGLLRVPTALAEALPRETDRLCPVLEPSIRKHLRVRVGAQDSVDRLPEAFRVGADRELAWRTRRGEESAAEESVFSVLGLARASCRMKD